MLQSPEYQSLSVNNKVSGMLWDNPSCCVNFLKWKVKQSDSWISLNSSEFSAMARTTVTATMTMTATRMTTWTKVLRLV